MILEISRKMSQVNYSTSPLFFSLIDYRNNYFCSNDPNKIIEFYDGFENRDQLIRWMKERPNGVAKIHEIAGDKDIVVVIPTADFNGKYAKECGDNIFKGLHMVFVESGEVPDPYFNFAHNCNVGIRKAMEYDPKWVVVSNDDVIKFDDISLLREKLEQISNDSFVVNIDYKDNTHRFRIARQNLLWGFILILLKNFSIKTNIRFNIFSRFMIYYKIDNRFKLKYKPFYENYTNELILGIKHPLYSHYLVYTVPGHFFIIGSELLQRRHKPLFDENFINSFEDSWLGIEFQYYGIKVNRINFKIDSVGGATLGVKSFARSLRDKASIALFNHYIDNNNYLLSKEKPLKKVKNEA